SLFESFNQKHRRCPRKGNGAILFRHSHLALTTMKISKLTFIPLVSILAVVFISASSSSAQSRRDYMTDAEIELVRDAQDIDARIDVLTKMIDRRFAVLKLDVGGPKIP